MLRIPRRIHRDRTQDAATATIRPASLECMFLHGVDGAGKETVVHVSEMHRGPDSRLCDIMSCGWLSANSSREICGEMRWKIGLA